MRADPSVRPKLKPRRVLQEGILSPILLLQGCANSRETSSSRKEEMLAARVGFEIKAGSKSVLRIHF